MEYERFPNLINLKMEHLIDPSPPGERVIPIDFRHLDYCDASGRSISFRACQSPDALCDWYEEKTGSFPGFVAPYLAYRTIYPHLDFPQKKKKGFFKQLGKYIVSFT